MFCSFALYAGWSGTTSEPLTLITLPCVNPSSYDKPLLASFNAESANYIWRSYIQIANTITKGKYGEYKLQLQKIDYSVCVGNTGQTIKKIVQSNESVICEYNFTVSRPYLMQVGNNISSNQTDALSNFYGFSSNSKQNILQQYGIRLTPLTLNKFKPNANAEYLVSQFVKKQEQRAVKSIEFGPKTSKVPWSNIFIYDGDITLDEQTLASDEISTIIVKNGNLTFSGSLKKNNLYIVPDGDIIFANACEEDQVIYGALITNNKFLSDIPYNNTNLLKPWCNWWGLSIYGSLIGQGLDELILQRRSKLNGWFVKTNTRDKYQTLLNGGAVTIIANPAISTSSPPWYTEFTNSFNSVKN